MTVEVGDAAPDFELKDQTGQPVRLSDYRGKKAVVLVFYPFTFTGVCEGELCSIRDEIDVFQNDDVQTLAVSVDSPFAHRVWAEQQGYQFPLLADFWPHGEVARTYGVFNDQLGCAVRGTFIIDRDGTVTYKVVHGLPDARDQDDYKHALEKVGALAS
ncbi:MAG: peroxiredoxin [Actinobacteria bacterium]|nr:peroxiredoxin [Actinomycetota bacterium]